MPFIVTLPIVFSHSSFVAHTKRPENDSSRKYINKTESRFIRHELENFSTACVRSEQQWATVSGIAL